MVSVIFDTKGRVKLTEPYLEHPFVCSNLQKQEVSRT